MRKEELDRLASEIKKGNNVSHQITPRELISCFGWLRRTPNCQSDVERYLEENQLEVEPNYTEVWVDSKITLRHKKRATTKLTDPIKTISILGAAHNSPLTVKKEGSLKEAITQMMFNNYSQLLVSSSQRGVDGFISWETIGTALTNGVKSDNIKDYMNSEVRILDHDTPLLKAIRIIYDNDFAVVKAQDGAICGIITTTDISSQFLTITEPFLLLEQIENYIRQILHNKVLVEDLQKIDNGRSEKIPTCIDDLTFGDYIWLMASDSIWNKLELSIDKKTFIKKLEEVRGIRNDITHFDPEGITEEQHNALNSMSQLLSSLSRFRK